VEHKSSVNKLERGEISERDLHREYVDRVGEGMWNDGFSGEFQSFCFRISGSFTEGSSKTSRFQTPNVTLLSSLH
jgi:hypothetical protein